MALPYFSLTLPFAPDGFKGFMLIASGPLKHIEDRMKGLLKIWRGIFGSWCSLAVDKKVKTCSSFVMGIMTSTTQVQ